jgi:hypothetical protein
MTVSILSHTLQIHSLHPFALAFLSAVTSTSRPRPAFYLLKSLGTFANPLASLILARGHFFTYYSDWRLIPLFFSFFSCENRLREVTVARAFPFPINARSNYGDSAS